MDRLPRGLSRERAGIRIRVWRDGRLAHTETLRGDPYSKALIARAKVRREQIVENLDLGLPTDSEARPYSLFPDAATAWLASVQCDEDTRKKYLNILNAVWLPRFHRLQVNHITRGAITEALAGTGTKIKTQKNYLGPLRQVLAHAGVNPNPCAGITWPRKKAKAEKPVVHRFRPDERERVIRSLDALHAKAMAIQQDNPRLRYSAHWCAVARVFYPLLFATGLRPGEALALCWQDYDGETVHIGATHTRGRRKEQTKTGEDRRVYVPTWVRPRLDQHPTRFRGGPIFTNSRGGPLTDTKRITPLWREALRKCRLPDRDPYACRHTRAAELLSTRVDHAEAAAQLGHNVAMFTWLYSEWIAEYAQRTDWSHLEGVTAERPPRGDVGGRQKADNGGG